MPYSETDMLKIIHELEVAQLELKLQNEELLLAKKEAETEAGKYSSICSKMLSNFRIRAGLPWVI